jgi:hypothetical protein
MADINYNVPSGVLSLAGDVPSYTTNVGHRYWRWYFTVPEGSLYSYATIAEAEIHATVGGADLTGSGTPLAKNVMSGNNESRAFDNDIDTAWEAQEFTDFSWLCYDFGVGSQTNVLEYTITAPDSYVSDTPTQWEFQYSDDGSSWTTVDSRTALSWNTSEVKVFNNFSIGSSGVVVNSPVINLTQNFELWYFNYYASALHFGAIPLSITFNDIQSSSNRMALHEVYYKTIALNLHQVHYEGTSTVIQLQEASYSLTAIALHHTAFQSPMDSTTIAVNESQWESIGSSSAINLHEQLWLSVGSTPTLGQHEVLWSSSLTNTAQSLHDSIYATISISPTLGLHQVSWSSAGSLNSVAGLHEVAWGSSALVTAIALHQTGLASEGSLNTVAALHQSSWASAGSLNTVFSMHESSWTVSWTALGLQQASYQSVVETLNLHSIRYESVPDTILSLHECRYRSNQTAPIILTGLIYARI